MFEAETRARMLGSFRSDVLAGLARQRKALPARWLYDDQGSELFEAITRQPEYYPTRTETAILRTSAVEIADFVGKDSVLIEYGAGAALKTEILLKALEPRAYAPVDIAADFLASSAARLGERFAELEIHPVIADFTTEFELPNSLPQGRKVGFFPGSTIGNLSLCEAVSFLARVSRHVGSNGFALIGIDLKKDIELLLAAYDDKSGVTASFNLNILARINRELGGNFDLSAFKHEARWNAEESAVEMHAVSNCRQIAVVDDEAFGFEAGETIHTESSRKYDLQGFADLAMTCGWRIGPIWTDPAALFAIVGIITA